jgi:small subunit ribosomal protein SAe
MYWLLAREVLRMRGEIPRNQPWDVMVDMFLQRDAEEAEKQQLQQAAETQPVAPPQPTIAQTQYDEYIASRPTVVTPSILPTTTTTATTTPVAIGSVGGGSGSGGSGSGAASLFQQSTDWATEGGDADYE